MSTKDYTLPTIEHATVTLTQYGRVEVRMDDGWAFYLLDEYPEGTPAEEICYYCYGVFSPQRDFDSTFVVVDKSTINPDQLFDGDNPPDETI
jgi:hypothetical protein